MRKANSLRRWLTACLPDELKNNPDRLLIFIEGGQVTARQSQTLSFVYKYTVKAVVTDFKGDADRLIVPVLAWISKEQPELLRKADSEPFSFVAELLDLETSDIEISIDLTERVIVTPHSNGSGYDVEHPPEPDFCNGFAGANASFTDAYAGELQLLDGNA